jgi:hypothetical protein
LELAVDGAADDGSGAGGDEAIDEGEVMATIMMVWST